MASPVLRVVPVAVHRLAHLNLSATVPVTHIIVQHSGNWVYRDQSGETSQNRTWGPSQIRALYDRRVVQAISHSWVSAAKGVRARRSRLHSGD
jgi:hypothetical protein